MYITCNVAPLGSISKAKLKPSNFLLSAFSRAKQREKEKMIVLILRNVVIGNSKYRIY